MFHNQSLNDKSSSRRGVFLFKFHAHFIRIPHWGVILQGHSEEQNAEKEANFMDYILPINLCPKSLARTEKNREILSVQERDESLENHYVSLSGGGKHE